MATANVQFVARMPEKLHADLARLAAREGTSMNHEMLIALRSHLDADKTRRSA